MALHENGRTKCSSSSRGRRSETPHAGLMETGSSGSNRMRNVGWSSLMQFMDRYGVFMPSP